MLNWLYPNICTQVIVETSNNKMLNKNPLCLFIESLSKKYKAVYYEK